MRRIRESPPPPSPCLCTLTDTLRRGLRSRGPDSSQDGQEVNEARPALTESTVCRLERDTGSSSWLTARMRTSFHRPSSWRRIYGVCIKCIAVTQQPTPIWLQDVPLVACTRSRSPGAGGGWKGEAGDPRPGQAGLRSMKRGGSKICSVASETGLARVPGGEREAIGRSGEMLARVNLAEFFPFAVGLHSSQDGSSFSRGRRTSFAEQRSIARRGHYDGVSLFKLSFCLLLDSVLLDRSQGLPARAVNEKFRKRIARRKLGAPHYFRLPRESYRALFRSSLSYTCWRRDHIP